MYKKEGVYYMNLGPGYRQVGTWYIPLVAQCRALNCGLSMGIFGIAKFYWER